jgi:5S rRNA maturation endonuclease (ribonuclease M5)
VESDKVVGTKGAGWLHRLRDRDDWHTQPYRRRVKIDDPAVASIDFNKMTYECYAALGPLRRGLLAHGLGVTAGSLNELGVGWSAQHNATTWPMKDADGDVVGIRLRKEDGSKFAVHGGREGVFIPANVPVGDGLLICEGASDCAALRDHGFDVIGRPSCTGGGQIIKAIVSKWNVREVAIVADADAPGQRGASRLASQLVGYVADGVRILTPRAKDAREWIKSGASRLDILDAISSAPVLQMTYSVRTVCQ